MPNENAPPQTGEKRRCEDSALILPPRKKAGPPDYWKNKGRHIGRTIHHFVNIGQLILAGLQLDKDLALSPANSIEKYPIETRLQYKVYTQVLNFVPKLEEGLMNGTISTDQLNDIATRMQAGIGAACHDDVKGVKHAIIGWITHPVEGLKPPINPKYMVGRGWNHDATAAELCSAGYDWNDPSVQNSLKDGSMTFGSDQWPICFYENRVYDPEHPWAGLLRGRLLVNAYKHIFTSPSSVDKSGVATKASNSVLNGMTTVTAASLVYVGTIVRFALGSQTTFTPNDTVTDSQTFYNVLLAFLTHPDERKNLNQLIAWWNGQVFSHVIITRRAPTAKSPLAMCLEERRRRVALEATQANVGM